jgi:hypothetical protein
MVFGVLWPATRPGLYNQRSPRCLSSRLEGSLPFGQPGGLLSRSARLAWSRLVCRRESVACLARLRTGRIESRPSA